MLRFMRLHPNTTPIAGHRHHPAADTRIPAVLDGHQFEGEQGMTRADPGVLHVHRKQLKADIQGHSGALIQRMAASPMRLSPEARWEYSTSLISAERGGLQDEFIEITEDEANQIVEPVRPR